MFDVGLFTFCCFLFAVGCLLFVLFCFILLFVVWFVGCYCLVLAYLGDCGLICFVLFLFASGLVPVYLLGCLLCFYCGVCGLFNSVVYGYWFIVFVLLNVYVVVYSCLFCFC